MNTQIFQDQEALLIYFNEYTVHYYSQSSNPWEAAYINCFQKDKSRDDAEVLQVGYIVFTYAEGTIPAGQENPNLNMLPTKVPVGQENHLEPERGRDFFVLYYTLDRFDDVINQLRYSDYKEKSMFALCDPLNHVWVIGNNLHVPIGSLYKY